MYIYILKKEREKELGSYYCKKLPSFPRLLLLPPVSLIRTRHQGGGKTKISKT